MFENQLKNEAFVAGESEKEPGAVTWQSPSNIAIVKYWGKHGNQLPNNPSVSFTLSAAHSVTRLEWIPKTGKGLRLRFRFEGREEPAFQAKIEKFLEQNIDILPFTEQFDLQIDSHNSFPHSSGIASSASSMSALVMCLLDMEQQIKKIPSPPDALRQKASWLSRLASGSAARSVYAVASLWGRTPSHSKSDDAWAVGLDDVHPVFKSYRDSILIIHAGTKAVSSRAGHALMEGNPFADVRYTQAHQHTTRLLKALQQGDIESFIQIAEAEALQLHALMMTSNPSFILLKPGTLAAIEKVREFRNSTAIPLSFTLDAGPNLHLLYPQDHESIVSEFIRRELFMYCEEGRWISDAVGNGPSRMP